MYQRLSLASFILLLCLSCHVTKAASPATEKNTSSIKENDTPGMPSSFFTFAQNAAQTALNASREHPVAAATAGTGLFVVAAPAVVSTPLLSWLGFGVAGSVAAAIQSSIGNVVAGGLFATLQSAAAGGAGAAVVNGAVSAAGGLTAAVAGASPWLMKKGGEIKGRESGGCKGEDGGKGCEGDGDGKGVPLAPPEEKDMGTPQARI
ncbi:hypothetical protein E4U41_006347 [Claviceps citrina]|nr:hypothetical protein E4U41_006347 [Claviceps citrina]